MPPRSSKKRRGAAADPPQARIDDEENRMKKNTMKRLIAAILLLNLACAPSAAALDTETTSAASFPCDIVFHAGGEGDLVLDGDKHRTLNYNGRTYVPLRAFAEFLGAYVSFGAAGKTGGSNTIDVSVAGNAPAIAPEWEDAEGCVSLYNLQYDTETSDTGEVFLRSGMLRVNKDLSDTEIVLWIAGGEDAAPFRIPGGHPIVLNEAIDPLRAGDIRPFVIGENFVGDVLFKAEAPPYAYGSEFVGTQLSSPLGFAFYPIGYTLKSVPDSSFGGAFLTYYVPRGAERPEDEFSGPERIHRLGYTVASKADGRLVTEPFSVGLRFYRLVTDADGGLHTGEPVLYKELKFGALSFDGEMLLRDSLLWDGLGDDGAHLPASDYLLDLAFPDEIRYSIDGGPVQSTQFGRSTAAGTSGLYPFSIRKPDPPPYGNGDTEVLLAPTRVRFLFDDARLEIPLRSDDILYLDGRTYIPLRLFAESMGAEVTWTPPGETESGRGRVEIGGLGVSPDK
jgi:hypothetical protein